MFPIKFTVMSGGPIPTIRVNLRTTIRFNPTVQNWCFALTYLAVPMEVVTAVAMIMSVVSVVTMAVDGRDGRRVDASVMMNTL